MDPFDKLPAEPCLEILIATCSKRTIKQLMQASPVMLRQFVAHKEYINRKLVVTEADLDDDMVQDAIAIILFPPRDDSSYFVPFDNHCLSWSN
ncbi:hypothetical protein RRF57_004784 [Xylaria bambusicola]|uniref:Uncharacterized protein n=1 Tax=Xylaria bambusicola TaxID=326684 RepID=A0AAN7UNR0_9PEZI